MRFYRLIGYGRPYQTGDSAMGSMIARGCVLPRIESYLNAIIPCFFLTTAFLATTGYAFEDQNIPGTAGVQKPATTASEKQIPVSAGQGAASDPKQKSNDESTQAPNTVVIVTAPRMDIPVQENPAATAVVTAAELKSMFKGITADEALRLVPGVKVDNQADGERVHISIRGQGLLTERGIRGIKVLLDGLPLNDPSGFAPDLFDVDWSTVRSIEVFRGPASALYGGGSAGGVININTRDGGPKPISGEGAVTTGSYDFWKAFSEIGGTTKNGLNYRVSASRNFGWGYRDHTAFHATNVYGKLSFHAGKSTQLTAITAYTRFFNENAEGLNIDQVSEDRRMANPDSLTYNEYQRTHRATAGFTGRTSLTPNQDLSFSVYYRHTLWGESVPSSVQHRTLETPGGIIQYSLQSGHGWLKNHLSIGSDLDWQGIDEYRRPNLGGAQEGNELLSWQHIGQRSLGLYAIDRLEFGPRWGLVTDVRNDRIRNELKDKLIINGLDLSGNASFQKTTGRIGLAWNPDERIGLYTSWGQGFLPPATEELANNPDRQGGFNKNLIPATSRGEELGVRGNAAKRLFYDVAFFHLATENDFGRYRVPSRPLETFYTNAGASRRYGLETAADWYATPSLVARMAYTFSDFKYTSVRTLQGDFAGKSMPNAPRHQGYLDLEYTWKNHLVLGTAAEFQSRSYVDATNLTWADGYTLFHPRVAFRWKSDWYQGELMISSRNVLGKEYIAFTEPDPDGNSYQPAPTRELFLSLRIRFGNP
jgi:iron complex outermembrane receptor protein